MDDVIEPDRENLPAASLTAAGTDMRQFRQILLWPVYLTTTERADIPDYTQHLLDASPDGSWFEVEDEFTDDPADFRERHYNEFCRVLPAVQRFLYGQGKGSATRHGEGESPSRSAGAAQHRSERETGPRRLSRPRYACCDRITTTLRDWR